MTVLKKGSRGEDVKQLQELLGINQDGIFGPNTEAALKTFQKDNGLTEDGQVIVDGGETWPKLNANNTTDAISTGNALNVASATNADGALTFINPFIKPFINPLNPLINPLINPLKPPKAGNYKEPLVIHTDPREYPEGTKPPILDKIKNAGHQIFENGPYDLNLFGIRSTNQTANSFDDWLGCAYQDDDMTWWDEFWEATTDPGLYYLENPIPKTGGTAILVPGQYKNTYRIDTHRKGKKGAHEALCQRSNKNVEVWRDNNKDNILDWEGEPKPGVFGINIHRANEDRNSHRSGQV